MLRRFIITMLMLAAFGEFGLAGDLSAEKVVPARLEIDKSQGMINALKLWREIIPEVKNEATVVTTMKEVEQHVGKKVIVRGIAWPNKSFPLSLIHPVYSARKSPFRPRLFVHSEFKFPKSVLWRPLIFEGTIISSRAEQKVFPDSIVQDYYLKIDWWGLDLSGDFEAVEYIRDLHFNGMFSRIRLAMLRPGSRRSPLLPCQFLGNDVSVTGRLRLGKIGLSLESTDLNHGKRKSPRVLGLNTNGLWQKKFFKYIGRPVRFRGFLMYQPGQYLSGYPEYRMWVSSWEFVSPLPKDEASRFISYSASKSGDD